MKTLLVLMFAVVTVVTISSCTTQKGCAMNKGYVGYSK